MRSITDRITSRPVMYQYDVHNTGTPVTCDTNVFQTAKEAASKWLTTRHTSTSHTPSNLWPHITNPWYSIRKKVIQSISVYDRSSRHKHATDYTDDPTPDDTPPEPNPNSPSDDSTTEDTWDKPWKWSSREEAISRTGLIYGITLNQIPGIEGGARMERYASNASRPNQPQGPSP